MLKATQFLALLLLAAGSSTLHSADRSASFEASEVFVLGNTAFALLHEFGHVIIRDFDVPLLGLEENSADTIAATSLVLIDRQHPEIELNTILGVTALVQSFVWQAGLEREQSDVAVWAQHGLSVQRFARLVCLLYGSDPTRFGWVAEASEMNEYRADSCEDEWRIAEHGTLWLRDTFGIAAEGAQPAPESSISIHYGPASDDTEAALLDLIRRTRFLELLVHIVESRFEFSESLDLVLEHCGTPNAYWDPENRQVVLCYELMTAFATVADGGEVSRLVERFHDGR